MADDKEEEFLQERTLGEGEFGKVYLVSTSQNNGDKVRTNGESISYEKCTQESGMRTLLYSCIDPSMLVHYVMADLGRCSLQLDPIYKLQPLVEDASSEQSISATNGQSFSRPKGPPPPLPKGPPLDTTCHKSPPSLPQNPPVASRAQSHLKNAESADSNCADQASSSEAQIQLSFSKKQPLIQCSPSIQKPVRRKYASKLRSKQMSGNMSPRKINEELISSENFNGPSRNSPSTKGDYKDGISDSGKLSPSQNANENSNSDCQGHNSDPCLMSDNIDNTENHLVDDSFVTMRKNSESADSYCADQVSSSEAQIQLSFSKKQPVIQCSTSIKKPVPKKRTSKVRSKQMVGNMSSSTVSEESVSSENVNGPSRNSPSTKGDYRDGISDSGKLSPAMTRQIGSHNAKANSNSDCHGHNSEPCLMSDNIDNTENHLVDDSVVTMRKNSESADSNCADKVSSSEAQIQLSFSKKHPVIQCSPSIQKPVPKKRTSKVRSKQMVGNMSSSTVSEESVSSENVNGPSRNSPSTKGDCRDGISDSGKLSPAMTRQIGSQNAKENSNSDCHGHNSEPCLMSDNIDNTENHLVDDSFLTMRKNSKQDLDTSVSSVDRILEEVHSKPTHMNSKPVVKPRPVPRKRLPLSKQSDQLDESDTNESSSLKGSHLPGDLTSSESEAEGEEFKVMRKKDRKLYLIAQEIVSSERVFVDVLKLLNVDFRVHVAKATENLGCPVIPADALNRILNDLLQLQNFNEDLLKDLEERLNKWESEKRISDIFVKKGPFLLLYSSYICNFENVMTMLDDACKRYPHFQAAVREFELSPRCASLRLKHYMSQPIERIAQYELLLQDYMKHLPPNFSDLKDTQTALNIVRQVAERIKESTHHGEHVKKLLEIQRSLIGQFQVIRPDRNFLKDGELMKLSRKELLQPRKFFLFSDVLLYTTPVPTGYRLNNVLPLTGMKVTVPNQDECNTKFSIISVQRSFTVVASSPQERNSWISALNSAINANSVKRSTVDSVRAGPQSLLDMDFVLGHKAPPWIPDSRVTTCMLCTCDFSITWRRHHCKACGKIVCGNCSDNKAPLRYLKYKAERVCYECFIALEAEAEKEVLSEKPSTLPPSQEVQQSPHCHQIRKSSKVHTATKSGSPAKSTLPPSQEEESKDIDESSPDGTGFSLGRLLERFTKLGHSSQQSSRCRLAVLKEVHANDQGATMSGYLKQLQKGKKWKRFWFVLKDKVLYTFKTSEDMAAITSMVLLGYEVTRFYEYSEGVESGLVFQCTHSNQSPVVYCADSTIATEKWVTAMREASVA